MTSRSRPGAGLVLPGFSVFNTPEAIGYRRWVEFCRRTLCCWSALSWWLKGLGGESATKLATQWAHNVLLNRFVIALLLENSLAQCLMRWEMFSFPLLSFSFFVLFPNTPQETEICPTSTFFSTLIPFHFIRVKKTHPCCYYLEHLNTDLLNQLLKVPLKSDTSLLGSFSFNLPPELATITWLVSAPQHTITNLISRISVGAYGTHNREQVAAPRFRCK